jgi:hypothetical protein
VPNRRDLDEVRASADDDEDPRAHRTSVDGRR